MAFTDDLISYWKLDESSGDAVDAHSSNTLTDNNTVGSAAGKIGSARDFELANTEFFSLADNASLSVTAGMAFTWSVWVMLESLPDFGNLSATILGKSDFSATTEYILYVNFSAHLVFYCGNGTAGADADAGFAAATGVWYHVLGWYDPAGGGTNNIRVNGATAVSVANASGIYDGATAFRMGACSNDTRYWDGLIDEVAFWKRVLTSDEQTALYNGGLGLPYDFSGVFKVAHVDAPRTIDRRPRVVAY